VPLNMAFLSVGFHSVIGTAGILPHMLLSEGIEMAGISGAMLQKGDRVTRKAVRE
jgi:hypothetical protein